MRADVAPCPRAVVNYKRLVVFLGQLLSDGACEHVHRASRGEVHDEAHGLAGTAGGCVVLGQDGQGHGATQKREAEGAVDGLVSVVINEVICGMKTTDYTGLEEGPGTNTSA